jgi:hypothetical protein
MEELRSNFAYNFVWVQNLVSEIKGRTQTEGAWKEGAGHKRNEVTER